MPRYADVFLIYSFLILTPNISSNQFFCRKSSHTPQKFEGFHHFTIQSCYQSSLAFCRWHHDSRRGCGACAAVGASVYCCAEHAQSKDRHFSKQTRSRWDTEHLFLIPFGGCRCYGWRSGRNTSIAKGSRQIPFWLFAVLLVRLWRN